jgi:hypothetical protein
LVGVGALIGLCVRAVRRGAVAAFVIALASVLAWWGSIEPRNDRD